MNTCPLRPPRLGLALLLIGLGLAAMLAAAPAAHAQGPAPSSNEACLQCHGNPELSKQLPSGEPLSLFIDDQHFATSVHAKNNIACVQCHTNISGYPHPSGFVPRDRREVTLSMNTQCRQCHDKEFSKNLDGMHMRALAAGDRNAAVCTDCHSAHEVQPPDQPRSRIPQTCAQCHSTIFDDYARSVHGAALLNGGNPDVPTCIDCHGVHNIGDPTSAAFRLKSPEICARCHTDQQKMAKYNLSTNVLNTYVADFHGTTVSLFEKQSPDAATNKAVCYDCHGVHNIMKVDDPNSTVYKQNLLKTCERCHPDATVSSFTGAWMSHYNATPQQYPLVYYINLFYWILIPLVIGAMVLFCLTDLYRRIRVRVAHAHEGAPS